ESFVLVPALHVTRGHQEYVDENPPDKSAGSRFSWVVRVELLPL
ncbi:hypothetical protein AVEN_202523-1, partial [Araneus ventricosus]